MGAMEKDVLLILYKRLGYIAVSAKRGQLRGLQEKGLQSRNVTASLLIKNYQCMQEEI